MTFLQVTTDQVIPKDFFTLKSMLTLTGATGAVFVISNGIQTAFNYNPKWLGLILAQIISLAGVYFSGGHGSDYFVGVINGFLIYATAAGTSSITGGGGNGPARGGNGPNRGGNIFENKRHFLTPWW